LVVLVLMTIGSGAMYVVAVVLPAVQAEFGVARTDAALPYTLLMVGFGLGGILMGRWADRIGVMWVALIGAAGLCTGFVAAGLSPNLWVFALAHGVFLGAFGSAATFAPLVADTSLWFVRRRGIAVAICASGNYLAGALWPPIVQHFVNTAGWRATYIGMGVFCALTMPLLAWRLRARPPAAGSPAPKSAHAPVPSTRPFGLSMAAAQGLLCVAGVACCVAMAMPQVHIVAYCGDLGYGAARGAEMLSLMLACGIVSRVVSGLICDRIGGLRTLLLGSVLQGLALLLFIPFNGLMRHRAQLRHHRA
jgi:MFS family permease